MVCNVGGNYRNSVEIFEYIIEDWRVYGSKKKWAYNTAADLIVEIGAAAWIMI